MGDRAMCQIRTSKGSLYVYTHWYGSELPGMAARAIEAARPRWGDESYATHILVDQLTKNGRDRETGYGLMLEPYCEDSYNGDEPSVVIDLVNRQLEIKGRHRSKGEYPFHQTEALYARLGD